MDKKRVSSIFSTSTLQELLCQFLQSFQSNKCTQLLLKARPYSVKGSHRFENWTIQPFPAFFFNIHKVFSHWEMASNYFSDFCSCSHTGSPRLDHLDALKRIALDFFSITNLYVYCSHIFCSFSLIILSSESQLPSFPLSVGFNLCYNTIFGSMLVDGSDENEYCSV